MKKFLSAALAASMLTAGLTTPAQAREDRVWTAGVIADAQAALERGARSCVGAKKQSICSVDDRVNGFRLVSIVARPDGLNKNVHMITVLLINPDGEILKDEAGKPYMIAAHVTDQVNGPAMLSQAFANLLPAAFNGSVAAGINAAFPACGKNCQTGGGSNNYLINTNTSRLESTLQAALQNNGCSSGTCPTSPPSGGGSGHTIDGPGSAPYNPGG